MMSTNSIVRLAVLLALVIFSTTAQAQIDITLDADVDILSNRAEAECFISLGEDEPYSAMNGDCRLLRNGSPWATTLVRGHSIPWPRNNFWFNSFYAIGPEVEPKQDVFCAKFGWPIAGSGAAHVITLGHATDSDLNVDFPEVSDCGSAAPPPKVQSFWLILNFCVGWDAHYSMSWSGPLRTGEYYQVRKLNEALYPIVTVYEQLGNTTSPSYFHTNKEHPTSYRVRINGPFGPGPWDSEWDYVGCGSGNPM